jgi:hypothetical protein
MSRIRHALDGQPGRLPDVRVESDDIVFVMTPPGTAHEGRLVIRCDVDGELWVSIQPAAASEEQLGS